MESRRAQFKDLDVGDVFFVKLSNTLRVRLRSSTPHSYFRLKDLLLCSSMEPDADVFVVGNIADLLTNFNKELGEKL